MDRHSAVLALALLCAPCTAQEARSLPASPAPQPIVRRSTSRPEPFSWGEKSSAALVEFFFAEQISPQDRAQWASAQAAISEHAEAAGLDFRRGSWDVRQIACSALPNHLFLAFTRAGGTADASAFTASIPRGAGQVRVIPILRHGYSPFSPAPINPLTISTFNHLRAEEHPTQPADWLATELCYAALAGARPQADQVGSGNDQLNSAAAFGRLTISAGNGGEISFIDRNASSRRNLWTMSFDANGKLLTVSLSPASLAREIAVQKTPAEVQGKPVPQAADVQGKLVPQAAEVQGKPVAATEISAKPVPVQ